MTKINQMFLFHGRQRQRRHFNSISLSSTISLSSILSKNIIKQQYNKNNSQILQLAVPNNTNRNNNNILLLPRCAFFSTTTKTTTTRFSFQQQQDTTVAGDGSNDSHHDKTSNNKNNSNNWRDLFSPILFINPWDMTHHEMNHNNNNSLYTLSSLHNDDLLYEYRTRHIIQLLNELFITGLIKSHNTITTESCNYILQQLLDQINLIVKENSSSNNNNTDNNNNNNASNVISNHIRRRQLLTLRACTILQTMELFEQNHSNNNNNRVPFPIPKPNRQTYNIILLMLSKTPSYENSNQDNNNNNSYIYDDHIKKKVIIMDYAINIVRQMEYRYNTYHELDMKPHNYHWNCVLLSYKEHVICNPNPNTNRLIIQKVYNLFQQLYIQRQEHHDEDIIGSTSLIHMLHILQQQQMNVNRYNSNKTNNNIEDIDPLIVQTALIAIQLWQDVLENNNNNENKHNNDEQVNKKRQIVVNQKISETVLRSSSSSIILPPPILSSHFYAHFLQIIRPLLSSSTISSYNNNNITDDTTIHYHLEDNRTLLSLRNEYFSKCFHLCCINGKMNMYVLKEFLMHVRNKSILEQHLGPYLHKIYQIPLDDAVHILYHQYIPNEWKQYAD